MNLVTLHHVGVAYDGYEALKNVDLTIAQDDFLGIIGPNGGGKTTLVKAILGTVPHTGEVVLAPELFRGKERLIGYMPQISNFDRRWYCRGCKGTGASFPGTRRKTGRKPSGCSKHRGSGRRHAAPSARCRAGRCSGRCCAGR